MRRISNPSAPAVLSIIERRSSRRSCERRSILVFDLVAGDTQKRSFLVLKEGGHLVSATQPVSQEETARHRVSGAMMRLAPSADVLGRIARLLEEGTIRPDVAIVYALQDAAQAWKDIAGNLPGVHGCHPNRPGSARRQVTRKDRASCGLDTCMKGDRSNGKDFSRITSNGVRQENDLETPRRLDTYDPASTRNDNERGA